jgi:hypothetical protein
MKSLEQTVQEIQLLRPHHQIWIPVSEHQSFAVDSHTLDDFSGYLCCFDTMSNMARDLEEIFEIFSRPRNLFGFRAIVRRR